MLIRRILAKTKNTEAFNLNTQEEIAYIDDKYKLKADKLLKYADVQTELGLFGNVFYCTVDDNKVKLFVIEAFGYGDLYVKGTYTEYVTVFIGKHIDAEGHQLDDFISSCAYHKPSNMVSIENLEMDGNQLHNLHAHNMEEAKKKLDAMYDNADYEIV